MRPAFPRALRLAPIALAALLAATAARAQTGDRLDISGTWSVNVQRLHAIGADTLGLSYNSSYSPTVRVDLRAIDLPMGKGAAKPSLHLIAGVAEDEEVLGPPVKGMLVGRFPVIDFSSGIVLDLPLETLVKGNAGIDLHVGWEGGYMLSRVGGQEFLERSKLRVDFVRSTGALQGSSFGFGEGRDETFGYDASVHRWDVKVCVQGRLFSAPMPAPPVAATKPGAKPAPPAAKPVNDTRLLWLFAEGDVDTDGGPGADGLRARVGVGMDLNALVTAIFTPLRQ